MRVHLLLLLLLLLLWFALRRYLRLLRWCWLSLLLHLKVGLELLKTILRQQRYDSTTYTRWHWHLRRYRSRGRGWSRRGQLLLGSR